MRLGLGFGLRLGGRGFGGIRGGRRLGLGGLDRGGLGDVAREAPDPRAALGANAVLAAEGSVVEGAQSRQGCAGILEDPVAFQIAEVETAVAPVRLGEPGGDRAAARAAEGAPGADAFDAGEIGDEIRLPVAVEVERSLVAVEDPRLAAEILAGHHRLVGGLHKFRRKLGPGRCRDEGRRDDGGEKAVQRPGEMSGPVCRHQ